MDNWPGLPDILSDLIDPRPSSLIDVNVAPQCQRDVMIPKDEENKQMNEAPYPESRQDFEIA